MYFFQPRHPDGQEDVRAIIRAVRQQEKACLGHVSETIRFTKLILGRDINWGVQVCNVME